jgi:NTE family protein
MKTAWVLRGGASFGAVQVGQARALLEAGHHPDLLYGASAGALNAAWLAADPTLEGLSTLAKLWTAMRARAVFPFNPVTVVAGLSGLLDHTVSSRSFARWLRQASPLRRLEEGALPLGVMATDIQTGEEVLLESGPAVPALLASCAVPGIFPPVNIGGRWLMDGGISNDTPVGRAVQAGADRVWVLPCVPEGKLAKPRSALGALLASSSIALGRQSAREVATWAGSCEVFVVPAPTVPGASPFRFDHTAELIEAAYELVSRWLPTAMAYGRAPAAGQPELTCGPSTSSNDSG